MKSNEELKAYYQKERAIDYYISKKYNLGDIDDELIKDVAEGAYYNDNKTYDGVEEGYKPYYDYLKGGNDMNKIERVIQDTNEFLAKNYKFCKENKLDHIIDDELLKAVAEGGYVNDNGTFDGIEEGYKPYYDYLKYGNQYQEEEVKEEPIMIEDNYNYEDTYETPYSFEYEPYMIEFNHEVTYNEPVYQQQEVVYEDNNIEEETCDINELISIVDILTNKISNIKKSIIHYISNYRPIMNQYTDTIEAILIE